MAANPKDFQITPWSHSGHVDKSGPSKPLVHNGTRPDVVAPTPMSHFKPTPPSGQGHKGLGNAGNANMGMPYAKSSDRTEMMTPMNHFAPTPHSKPTPPAEAKKWMKKGYSMESPS